MTIEEAARATGRSVKTVRRRLGDGTLTGRKDDRGHWHVDEASVLRWIHPDQALTTIDPGQLDSVDTLGHVVSTLRSEVLDELWELRAAVGRLESEVVAQRATIEQLAQAIVPGPAPWWRRWLGRKKQEKGGP
ncbi:MAG: helix-turn-helix domain-containing protein [Clostridia bacterium]